MDRTTRQRMHCMEVWGGNELVDRCFQTPGLEVWVYSRPFGGAAAGGDVYYLSSCASGRITRTLLADVSGHGELVSHLALALRDLMRDNVNHIKQTRVVRAVNRQFAEIVEQGGFATALVSTFFAPTKTLRVSNAGHPPPLLFRGSVAEWSELKSEGSDSLQLTNVPLGIVEDAGYRYVSERLSPGDMVLSYTDAVTEALDQEGRPLGQAGILRLVQELGEERPHELIPTVVSKIKQFGKMNLQEDDATLLLCRATGGRPSFASDLFAPLRLMQPVVDQTVIARPS